MVDTTASSGVAGSQSPAAVGGLDRVPVVRIGGVPVAAVTLQDALEIMLAAPAAGRRLRVHFSTTHTIVLSKTDERLRAALLDGGLVVPDGMPLVWVARARGYRMGRVCGPDFLPALADAGREIGARHYFIGGGPGVAETLAARLTARYPGLVVAGTEMPPFRPLAADEKAAMIDRLNDARPDYVWVGLGTPKQDLWLAEHRASLNASALLAVGAAFDIIGGFRPRAPIIMQRAGMEWAFRFMQEPRRLGPRYIVANTKFLGLVAEDALRRRSPGR